MRSFAGLRLSAVALCTGLVFTCSTYGDEREEIKLRIQEIKKQASQLLEEGRKDKAAGLMREQEELMNKLRRMGGEGRAEGRGPSPEQMEKFERAMQKVRHLRIASEHLKHAEMHDMALNLMRQAEGIEQDLRNAKEKMAEQMQGIKEQPRRDQLQRQSPEARRQEGRGLEDRLNGVQRGLDELRAENQQLRMMIEKIAQGLQQPKLGENSQSNPKQPRVEESMLTFSKRQLARLDKDKSGFLTRDEWIEDRNSFYSFSDVDINKDGKVDVEEYAIFRNKR